MKFSGSNIRHAPVKKKKKKKPALDFISPKILPECESGSR